MTEPIIYGLMTGGVGLVLWATGSASDRIQTLKNRKKEDA